jgi:hypothetical protein
MKKVGKYGKCKLKNIVKYNLLGLLVGHTVENVDYQRKLKGTENGVLHRTTFLIRSRYSPVTINRVSKLRESFNILHKLAVELCHRKWNVHINVSIFSNLFSQNKNKI